ncbi:hypothetical protein [Telluribacter sp. SYSU D00476]|uniref:hypothetical protein n=1 Tax=Telluribacter sp. SYSU D00476 TaxID=2811430 RepID=UPI001FF458D1|nr:hypothetical protein [Telluribacter sp. SYSU D00476]
MSFTFDNTSSSYQPFSFDTEEQKKKLQALAEHYRAQIEAQWGEVKDDTIYYGKHAIVIGGVVAGVYLMMEALLPNEDKPVADKPRKESSSSMGGALQGLALSIALAWAKKRLTDFLEAEHNTNAQSEL